MKLISAAGTLIVREAGGVCIDTEGMQHCAHLRKSLKNNFCFVCWRRTIGFNVSADDLCVIWKTGPSNHSSTYAIEIRKRLKITLKLKSHFFGFPKTSQNPIVWNLFIKIKSRLVNPIFRLNYYKPIRLFPVETELVYTNLSNALLCRIYYH